MRIIFACIAIAVLIFGNRPVLEHDNDGLEVSSCTSRFNKLLSYQGYKTWDDFDKHNNYGTD